MSFEKRPSNITPTGWRKGWGEHTRSPEFQAQIEADIAYRPDGELFMGITVGHVLWALVCLDLGGALALFFDRVVL